MKIFHIFLFLINFSNIYSFKHTITNGHLNKITYKPTLYSDKRASLLYNENKGCNLNRKETNPNKIQSFLKLIRSNNIIPTIFLCFSGGWIMNPSIYNLFNSSKFIVSIIDTVLILSSSMALNDIYDVNIDKINSPDRPLVNGEITMTEALTFVGLSACLSEYLALQYLPDNLILIVNLAILNITIYTPILKKILIVKNISCAGLIAFSLFFSGLAASNTVMTINKNFGLLMIAMRSIFFGSWCCELLLDIRDYNGDKINNILTMPTFFGKDFAWVFSNIILSFNIISNALTLCYLYNNQYISLGISVILSPLLFNLYKIKKDNYSKKSIKKFMNDSNVPLLILLSYLSTLAYISI